MNFRQWCKRILYGYIPGISGKFPYCKCPVFFPPGSETFLAACRQGIYEADVARVLDSLAFANSTIFDIGANIGLLSIWALRSCETCTVVSVEASPTVLPFLRRTMAANSFGARWKLVESAIGERDGVTSFSLSPPGQDQFDGIRKTIRSSGSTAVEVPIARLDELWSKLGKPQVSVIKCDVEGAEIQVLQGAQECLAKTNAAVITEWNRYNLAAYGTAPASLVTFALECDYRLFTIPGFVEVTDAPALRLHMLETENYLLVKRGIG